MRKKWLWWLGGIGLYFLAYKALARGKKGELAIDIQGLKPESTSAMLTAILNANATCRGLPRITKLLTGPGRLIPGPGFGYTVEAEWNHDVLGPIKDQTRICLERHLQAVTPGVTVTATRLS